MFRRVSLCSQRAHSEVVTNVRQESGTLISGGTGRKALAGRPTVTLPTLGLAVPAVKDRPWSDSSTSTARRAPRPRGSSNAPRLQALGTLECPWTSWETALQRAQDSAGMSSAPVESESSGPHPTQGQPLPPEWAWTGD